MNGVEEEILNPGLEISSFSSFQEERKLKRLKKASEDREEELDDGLDPLFSVQIDKSETELGNFDGFEEGLENKEEKKSEKGSEKRKRRSKEKNPAESAREKRRIDKERNAHLEQLHAESQKLLRETRDASFKPVAVAEKPISSVLEKIRRRKQELLQNYAVTDEGDQRVQTESTMSNSNVGGDLPSKLVIDEESLETSKAEEDFTNDKMQESADHSNREDASCYSSDSSDESSSEEEESYDKENINPILQRSTTVNLYKNNDLVNGFLDMEAEEEDDSDHDKMRFDDDEDDDDSNEAEGLADMIEPGFKEKKKDIEIRNELHQKWLQYQDAADTENLLQRLTSHSKSSIIPSLLKKEEDGEESEEEGDEDEEEEEDPEQPGSLSRVNSVRQNARNAKKNMAMMFTDPTDAYVSDDEETEQTVLRNCLILDHSLDKSSGFAPAEDENSREVFGLIRKVNSLPQTKKKKPNPISASLDCLAIGRNTAAFKPSFMGRGAGSVVTSSLRQASSVSRSFIFSRDDSNSRSSDVAIDNLPDEPRQQPGKVKAPERSTQVKRASSEVSQGASLFQILRRSVDRVALTSSNRAGEHISSSQAVRQFSAFRLTKKTS